MVWFDGYCSSHRDNTTIPPEVIGGTAYCRVPIDRCVRHGTLIITIQHGDVRRCSRCKEPLMQGQVCGKPLVKR